MQHAGLCERRVARPLKAGVGRVQLGIERPKPRGSLLPPRPAFPHRAFFGKQHYYYTPFVKRFRPGMIFPVFSLFIQAFPYIPARKLHILTSGPKRTVHAAHDPKRRAPQLFSFQ